MAIGIDTVLFSLHAGMAHLFNIPQFELDKSESKILADSMTEVARHYDVKVDPKVMAWIGLFGVCVSIYGPRIGSVLMDKKSAKKKEPAAQPKVTASDPSGNVVEFPLPMVSDPMQFQDLSGGGLQ